jgi:hypothetical protein
VKSWVDGFRKPDYRVALVYVVTHEANSGLGRAVRYQQARDDTGTGRWVDPVLAVRADRLIPETAHTIESTAYVDDLYVVDRNGYVLYESHREDDGRMPEPWLGMDAIIAERNRPPTVAEQEQFLAAAVPLLERGDELARPVLDQVRTAMDQHDARGEPQPSTQLSFPSRLDQRMTELRRITGSGLASPNAIASPPPQPGPGSHGRRSVDGRSREL